MWNTQASITDVIARMHTNPVLHWSSQLLCGDPPCVWTEIWIAGGNKPI